MTNFFLEIEQNDEERNGSQHSINIIEIKDMSFKSNNRIFPLSNTDKIEKKAFMPQGELIQWLILLARKRHLKSVLEKDGKDN